MSLEPGRTLSQYRLLAPIGEGGMGVVWRATDSTLGRDVAIKVLPDLFANDPERLARFEREAKLLASLNHPNIAAIYGLHSADGIRFLAMELVEGEDLAQRLEHGAIPVSEALPLALQVAQALEHAHERGVIHRDLKPANVKLTSEGKAKVLDFGLAKALEGEPGRAASSSVMSQSPTITGHLTGVDVLLGTAAYMAPEQARGHVADKRADIWAFGALVMEMLTGRRLFEGETISDTLASVLKTDPDWSALPADTPPRLRALLKRCLQRDPKQRLRDIGEARIALEEMIAGKEDAAAVAAPAGIGGVPRWLAAAAGIALGVLAMLGLSRLAGPPAAKPPLRKFHLAVPPVEGATPSFPAISPDGRTVAYTASGSIWLQSLADLQPREIKVSHDPSHLFWSPDGKHIGYISGSQILKTSLDGSENQAICDIRGEISGGGGGAAWGRDGMIVFTRADSGGIYQAPAVGGDPKTLFTPDSTESDFHEPSLLPGGRGIIFAVHRLRSGINSIGLWSGGKRKTLLELPEQTLTTPAYDPSGYILFGRAPTTPGIWALPFSLSRLEATGPPFLVTPGGSAPSVSSDGTLVLISSSTQGARQLVWWNRDGKEEGTLGVSEGAAAAAALSADGRRAAWSITQNGNRDIWIFDTARGTRTRLTFDPGNDDAPGWSPSGDRIVYHSLASGASPPTGFRLVTRAADGTGVVDTLAAGVVGRFTPDGSHVIYIDVAHPPSLWSIYEVPFHGPRTPRLLVQGNPRAAAGVVSPSGHLLAYMSNESGQWEVSLARYPSCEGRWQVSTAGGQWPRWAARGDRLYFSQGQDIMEVEVTGVETPVLGTPRRLFSRPPLGMGGFSLYPSFEVTGDGSRFLGLRAVGREGPGLGVVVVQSWAAEFAKKK